MNMFRSDNTEGFTAAQLAQLAAMNDEGFTAAQLAAMNDEYHQALQIALCNTWYGAEGTDQDKLDQIAQSVAESVLKRHGAA